MGHITNKKEKFVIPGTLIECESGRYLAYYEHRTDIIANGENEKDAMKNLKKMYKIIQSEEGKGSENNKPIDLPPATKIKSFTDKLDSI